MKKMAAGSFKARCLAVMDEVQVRRETVLITKHGKPVTKLMPSPDYSGITLISGEFPEAVVS
ncbi:MAG TPA: type II toxin-antitoxin system prevent-host-death family antitoxin [Terriglobales bacterium]|nr:type II toxin-antitoxin system prevent-host-death family antitoxin [Terriglobales bacterium]